MKLTANRNIVSPTKEVLDIHLEWDPSNEEQDGLAALVATLVDLVTKYYNLNTLVDEE
jgi:hypothetical protein